MVYSLENIMEFVMDKTGCGRDEVNEGSDLLNDLGCCGDDLDELMEKYATQYNVNMDNYLWYFHNEDEGVTNNFGASFFKPPYERVKHIPITPTLLLACANLGKWAVSYPDHKLPKYRYDMLVNMAFVILVLVILIYKCAA